MGNFSSLLSRIIFIRFFFFVFYFVFVGSVCNEENTCLLITFGFKTFEMSVRLKTLINIQIPHDHDSRTIKKEFK